MDLISHHSQPSCIPMVKNIIDYNATKKTHILPTRTHPMPLQWWYYLLWPGDCNIAIALLATHRITSQKCTSSINHSASLDCQSCCWLRTASHPPQLVCRVGECIKKGKKVSEIDGDRDITIRGRKHELAQIIFSSESHKNWGSYGDSKRLTRRSPYQQ